MTDLAQQARPFEREERYIVIKRKYLDWRKDAAIVEILQRSPGATVKAVVIEADWPEYETVWRMIEDRVTGTSLAFRDAQPGEGEETFTQSDVDEAKDAGATYVLSSLAEKLGVEWSIRDGSETWEGDVWATMAGILEEAGVWDPDTDAIAKLASRPDRNPDASLPGHNPLREALTDFAVEAIEAWKLNDEDGIDKAIECAAGRIASL